MTDISHRERPLVLVVEDVALMRNLVCQCLKESNFELAEAETVEEALRRAEELRPDIILLDVVLPDGDGFHVCRQLRSQPWGAMLPVVMMTGLDDLESISRAFDAGATDFITKPITWGILGHRVAYIIRSSRAEERIRSLAYFDPLTGLPNRTHFSEHLEMLLAMARRRQGNVAILLLDLDRFKKINETLGHGSGDRLLQEVATRLKSAVRTSDTLSRLTDEVLPHISRFGGDEFVITLADAGNLGGIARVAQRLLRQVALPLTLEGCEVFTSASIGISIFPNDGEDAAELLKNADSAMYHAKNQGRNNFQFYAREMNATAMERLNLESQLRRALERQELFLHYQPQVETVSGRIVGLEALMRWDHAELGPIPPERFIPLAEESDLIFELDEWVLRQVAEQIRHWRTTGMEGVRVAVNLSGQHFSRRSILTLLDTILGQDEGIGQYLELEITERALMKEGETTMEILRGLRQRGITLAIDDFGTGYSSLSYLRRFPIDSLKIDKSFINDTPDDADGVAIATAIIAMGQSLNLQVLAEGVETEEQRSFLASRGCPLIQGYLFSRPLQAEDVTPLLKAGRITL